MPVGTRRALRLGVRFSAWAADAALAALSVLHLSHRAPWVIVIYMVAVTPWLYLLAWLAAGAGLATRDRPLVAASAVLVALQLWWVVPDFNPVSHVAALPAGAVALRLFDANVSWTTYNLSELGAEIKADQAQVVALEEPNDTALASLARTGALVGRPHYRLILTNGGDNGMALYSRFPLKDPDVWYAAQHPEFRAWLELPGGHRLRLDVVHVHAPVGGPAPALWADQMGAVRAELAREPHPLVVMGDFNATWYDWHFQAILGLGLRDAAVVAGQGWVMTYPCNQAPLVPFMRIDHILISAGVALENYRVGRGEGLEEHRPIMVMVSVG